MRLIKKDTHTQIFIHAHVIIQSSDNESKFLKNTVTKTASEKSIDAEQRSQTIVKNKIK